MLVIATTFTLLMLPGLFSLVPDLLFSRSLAEKLGTIGLSGIGIKVVDEFLNATV